MTFRAVTTMAAIVSAALLVCLLAFPQIIYWLFSLQGNGLGDFLAKRAGILFLGFAVLAFMSKDTQSSEVICLVSAAIGVAMGAMALLGIFELARGNVGYGVLIAIFVEFVFALAYLHLWRAHASK